MLRRGSLRYCREHLPDIYMTYILYPLIWKWKPADHRSPQSLKWQSCVEGFMQSVSRLKVKEEVGQHSPTLYRLGATPSARTFIPDNRLCCRGFSKIVRPKAISQTVTLKCFDWMRDLQYKYVCSRSHRPAYNKCAHRHTYHTLYTFIITYTVCIHSFSTYIFTNIHTYAHIHTSCLSQCHVLQSFSIQMQFVCFEALYGLMGEYYTHNYI